MTPTSTAVTVDNREQAIREQVASYRSYLTAAERQETKGYHYPDPLHVAKMQVVVRALEDLGAKLHITID